MFGKRGDLWWAEKMRRGSYSKYWERESEHVYDDAGIPEAGEVGGVVGG